MSFTINSIFNIVPVFASVVQPLLDGDGEDDDVFATIVSLFCMNFSRQREICTKHFSKLSIP